MPDPRRLPRRLGQLALALATMAGISALAHVPIGDEPTAGAVRLALRTRSARIEICRERSPSELSALPAHLRQVEICDERPIDYRLSLTIDGERRLERRVEHRGIRRTRPLVVDELIPVEPGARRIEVRFAPAPGATEGLSEAELSGLPRSVLDRTFRIAPGRIELVVLDENGALTRLQDRR